MRRLVKRFDDLHIIIGAAAGSSADQRDRRHGNSLIDDGNPVFLADIFSRLHEILRLRGDFVIYIAAQSVHVAVDAVEQADAHGDGPHIEIGLFYHLIGFFNFGNIDHAVTSHSVHQIENIFTLSLDLYTHVAADLLEISGEIGKCEVRVRRITDHHHMEKSLTD